MVSTRTWVQLGLVLAVLVVFGSRSSAQTISCSSDDGHRHYCPADTRGRVRMVKQNSESACQEGSSWGFDERGIWVDQGCRADFVVDSQQYTGSGQGSTVSCSSDDGGRHYCPASQGRVQLLKQRSDSPCQQGYSWGSDDRGIWVDHGCRADFAIEGGWDREGNRDDRERDHDRDGDYDRNRDSGQGSNEGQVVSCSSDDMHRHYCPADTRGGVRLLKQRSDSSCRQGRGWGYDRRGIWVDHGCRGDFQVGR